MRRSIPEMRMWPARRAGQAARPADGYAPILDVSAARGDRERQLAMAHTERRLAAVGRR